MRRDGSLERAIELAVNAHAGQLDKVGIPYILHPLRVMLAVSDLPVHYMSGTVLKADTNAMIVAVLHDVVEDTDVEADDLRLEGFEPAIIEALRMLSRPGPEVPDRPTYMDYIRAIRKAHEVENPDPISMEAARIARRVKLADLKDNLSRIEQLPPDERGIETRYRRALFILEGKAD